MNKVDEVEEMLNKNLFDILFLAETKIDSTVSSTLPSQQGYRIVRKDRFRRSKLEPADIESICLDLQDKKCRFIVCACYRSPGKCN